MNDLELIEQVRALGGRLWVEDDAVRFVAPKSERWKELLRVLRERKEAIRALLLRDRIEAVPRTEALPLSFAQERLWFMEQLEPGRALFNLPMALRLDGRLEVEALRGALDRHIERHEALRTTMDSAGGRGVQRIRPHVRFDLPVEVHLGATELEVQEWLADQATRPFDISRDLLIRASLWRIGDRAHVLSIVLHHAVSDAWSLGILVRESMAAYDGLVRGREVQLPPLTIQYADYATWQRARLSGERLRQELAHWTRSLEGLQPLDLPTDRARPPTQSYRGDVTQGRVLSGGALAQLNELARAEGATLFIALLAATQALLGSYAGSRDVAVGSPVAGRTHAELEGLVGLFVNTLVLRTRWEGDLPFVELLRLAREVALQAYAHQEVPFERVVDALAPVRDPSRAPLAQVVVVLQNADLPEVAFPELQVSAVPSPLGRLTVDLWLSFVQRADGLHLTAEYAADLFERQTIDRLVSHLGCVLTRIVEQVAAPLSAICAVAPEEAHGLLELGLGPARGGGSTWAERLAEQARIRPAAAAVTTDRGTVDYATLDRRTNQLARHLMALGVGPEVPVGVFADRELELVLAAVAVLKAGGVYVPLDPALPLKRLAAVIDDTGTRVILAPERLADDLPESGARVVRVDPEVRCAATEPDHAVATRVRPENAAYFITTSGSTGKPKATVLTHEGLAYLVDNADVWGIGAGTAVLQFFRIGFDGSIPELLVPLAVGGVVHLAEDLTPGEDLRQLLVDRSIQVATLPPAALALFPADPPPALRTAVVAGEACPPAVAARWGVHLGGGLRNAYGPTEATVCATVFPFDPDRADFPIGRPLADVRVYVLGPEAQLVPRGVAGELYLGGRGLARGYLGRPGTTAERFVPDPWVPGARMYRTGDLVRWAADGALTFLGRVDHQVKLRGFRIELGEIASALHAYPGVDAAVVVLGERHGQPRLIAYVVGARAEASELRHHLAQHLPDYMIPSVFVPLRALPLSASGKVDRDALPDPPEPEPEGVGDGAGPGTPMELALAAVFAEVLGRPLSPNQNFFEAGGDSILGIQIVARARVAGIRFTPRQLFQHPTLAALAAVAEIDLAPPPADDAGDMPLLPIHRYFLDRGLVSTDHFCWTLLVELDDSVEPGLLEDAIRTATTTHDALNLRFSPPADGWAVATDRSTSVTFTRITATAESEIAACKAQAERSLDLARGPVTRAVWIDRPGLRPMLLWVVHHFLMDGVSWRILLHEVLYVHDALRDGRPTTLPTSSSYTAFARRLERHARTEAVAELGYWTSRPTAPPVPRDFDCTDFGSVGTTARVSRMLDPVRTRQLLELAPSAYHTRVNDLLLTAWAAALVDWAGGSTTLVAIEGHGREELFDGLDLSRTVGWFTSLYPLALTVDPEAPPGDQIRTIKEQIREVPHGGIGHGALRHLGPEDARARLAAIAAPEVSFNYMGQLGAGAGSDRVTLVRSDVPVWSDANQRTHALDLGCSVDLDGALAVTLAYSTDLHRESTAEALLRGFLSRLASLIDHCISPDAGGFTASDFPLARLGSEALDAFARRHPDLVDVFGLSPMQSGMLFHTLREPGTGVYVEQLHCVIEGIDDLGAFELAWHHLAEIEPMLRTTFHWEGLPAPVQVVHRDARPELVRADWRHLEPGEQRAALARSLAEDRVRGFDLSAGPPLRLFVARLDATRHLFSWTHHHILMDGWCFSIVLRDLFSAYAEHAPPAPRGATFRTYIEWLGRQDTAAALTYWTERVAGSAGTRLAEGWTPGLAGEPKPRVDRTLDRRTTAALEARARAAQVPIGTLVHAAWAVVLARRAGVAKVVFGSTTSGRPAELPHVEDIVGLFINTLPVFVDTSDELDVEPWLRALRDQLADLRQNEIVPLWEVQQRSAAPGGRELFDTLVVFENFADASGGLSAPGPLRVSELEVREQTSFFLTAAAAPGPEMTLSVLFDGARVGARAAELILDHWAEVVAALAEPTARRVGDLPRLGRSERREIEARAGTPPLPRAPSAIEQFVQVARRTPDQVAVEGGGSSLTYAGLDAAANALAQRLVDARVGPGALVAVCVERSPALVVCQLAVWKVGGAFVALDPANPDEHLGFVLNDTGARVLLVGREGAARLAPAGRTMIAVDATVPTDPPPPPLVALPQTDDLAYVIYTSGSTGRPKGVAVRHGGLAQLLAWHTHRYELGSTERSSLVASPGFDASVWEIWPTLAAGGTVAVLPDPLRTDPAGLARWLVAAGITVSFLPTPLAEAVLAEAWAPDSALRVLLTGGDRLVRRPRVGLPFRLVNHYGPTEVTVVSTAGDVEPDGVGAPDIGRPIPGLRCRVLDRDLEVVPIGVPGELYVAGEGLARGYWNRPGTTAERFLPDPYSDRPGGRMYRTGDRVRWSADGVLEYLERVDRQVKLRGHRIELGEIEHCLSAHPAVRAAVVELRAAPSAEPQLVAYVVPRAAEPDLARSVRDHVRRALPPYLVPARFVWLDALPQTSSGKVDRSKLPDPPVEATSTPATDHERRVAALFAEVLRVERVEVDDDFFAHGGHSLLATQLVSRVRVALGAELGLRELFEASTPRELARRLVGGAATAVRIPQVGRGGDLPLSFAQQRLWFLDRLLPNRAMYHLPLVLRIDGPLSDDALRRALLQLVERHESLRTTFVVRDGQPWQHVGDGADFLLRVVSAADAGDPEGAVRRVVDAEMGTPFDLAQGPLMRATLVRLAPERLVLVLVLHHAIADGWSMGVLVDELGHYLRAAHAGQEASLPPLPVQYVDYAAWQHTQLAMHEDQLAYWRSALADLPALDLPIAHPRPPVASHRGGDVVFELPEEITRQVRGLARESGATPFMVVCAAFQVLLGRLSGQTDFGVGTPIAGRNHAQLEPLIGFFVNTLVLRADLSGDPTVRGCLERVRQTTLAAYDHADLPFDRLVEVLAPPRDLSRQPLFQVMLSWHNQGEKPIDVPNLRVEALAVPAETAKFDLLLTIAESGDRWVGALEFATDLFDREAASGLVERFVTLLRAFVGDPESRISRLPLLTHAERDRLPSLVDGGALAAASLDVYSLVARGLERDPEGEALIASDVVLRRAELGRRVHRLAHHLIALGVGADVRVAIALPRTSDLVVAVLAVLAAGGAYVPLDPAYPAERNRFVRDDSGCRVLITHGGLVEPGTALLVDLERDRSVVAAQPDHPPLRRIDPRSLAYVIYTSGSTGTPKGVAIAHASTVAFLEWCGLAFSADELAGVLAATSVCFDLSVFELLAPLCHGGRIVLAEHALALATLPARGNVTLLNTVPSAAEALLTIGGIPGSVRTVNLAGEPLTAALAARVRALPNVRRLCNLYGPTEDTTYSTVAEVEGAVSIGRPLPGTRAYVLDPQLEPTPVGVEGELYLAGAGLSRGYLGRPGQTAARYLPDPFAPGRMYRTGDRVRWNRSGALEYLGRIDHQVKVRGFRIELGEVEAALSVVGGVRDVAVLATPGADGNPGLVAFVAGPAVPSPELLRSRLAERLPEFMIPSRFCVLEALPLSPNGKIDRRTLAATEVAGNRAPTVGPRDSVELRLHEIWQRLLGPGPFGVHDEFFAVGGHSLLGVRLLADIERAFGQSLPLTRLFRSATIESLAETVRSQRGGESGASPLVHLSDGHGSPILCLHAIGGSALSFVPLAHAMGEGTPIAAFHAPGLDDDEAPLDSVGALAERYLPFVPPGRPWLVGWSFGGLIAVTLAALLEARGDEVAGVVLLDSWLPTGDTSLPSDHEVSMLVAREQGIRLPETGLTGEPSEVLAQLASLASSQGIWPPRNAAARLARAHRVYQAHVRATSTFRPRPIAAPILLVRPSSAEVLASDPTGGWSTVSAVEVLRTPGDHYTLLRPPHVTELARALRVHLGRPERP